MIINRFLPIIFLLANTSFAGNPGPTFEVNLYPDKTTTKSAKAALVISFVCDPTKYGIILNDQRGFSGEVVQVHFDERAILNLKTARASDSAILLEEVWDDSEKMLIDRLKSTSKIRVIYLTKKNESLDYIFSVKQVYGQLDQIRKDCEVYKDSPNETKATDIAPKETRSKLNN